MKTVYKPWGREEWLELNNRYCYKRIYINAGYKTSYQYHNFKSETNYIISGEAEIWLENEDGIVEKKIMRAGEYFNVTPPRKHRVIAITDIILQEVSTPEVDDVIRIEDDTKRPDGKIDGEHCKPAVLILAAGYGSRLKNLTENVNKVLLPINNKAIISHIVDMFPREYDFIVALGYKGDSVEEYLRVTHKDRNFIFEKIDTFEADRSGPGLSALQCSRHLQRPFYFITGDCIIDSSIPHLDGNWIGIQETSYPEKYSTAKIDDRGKVIAFSDKSSDGFDNAFIGLGGIIDYKTFWEELEKEKENHEIVKAFRNPSVYNFLGSRKLKWFDTGNLDDLMRAREYFNDRPLSLSKNTGEITYNDSGIFLKFIPDRKILSNRAERGRILAELIPPNFNFCDNFIYYDWTEGKTLYEIDKLQVYVDFLEEFKIRIAETKESSKESIKKFYIEKTKERYQKFVSKNGNRYFEDEFEVNGVKLPSVQKLLSDFNFETLMNNSFYEKFHGDLQFDNVIYSEKNKKFFYIDWRDSFDDSIDAGDLYYDLAKLYGGLMIPYNIMKDENRIIFSEGYYSVNFSYPVSENLVRFKSIYEKWIIDNGLDLNKVKKITGLIYLNMSPLHEDKFGKMLWFKSIEILAQI